MPKRSNEFQELVSLIQKALAPSDATVTDSALVGEDSREIDILIDGKFGHFQMKVAVEAKDEKRKMDLVKFESIIGKYFSEGGIKVNKVVVVTRAGFYNPVKERAKLLGIDLMTLQEAKTTNWHRFSNASLSFKVQPHICGLDFTPPISRLDSQRLWNEATMLCPHGQNHGSAMKRAAGEVFGRWFPKNLDMFNNAVQQIQNEHDGAGHIHITMPHNGWSVVFHGKKHQITSMTARLHIVSASADINSTEYELCSEDGTTKRFQKIQATAGGKKLTFLLPETPHVPEKIILNIEDAISEAKKDRDRRRKTLARHQKNSKNNS